MAKAGRHLQRNSTEGRCGQALIEVAVFGAIFVMILGAMISYGLRFDNNQRIQQQAFRRALKIASDQTTGGGTYMLMEDVYVPNPGDPFGIGSGMPIIASGDIVRTHEMDARSGTAVDPDDLPTLVMDTQLGWTNDPTQPKIMQRYIFRNAGFRYENTSAPISDTQMDKYKFIYGDALKITDTQVRLVDTCSGQMVGFNPCYSQAVMLVDEDVCRAACDRATKDSDTNCTSLCGAVLNPPNQNNQTAFSSANGGPWYAQGATTTQGYWEFPVLDELFGKDTSGTGVPGPAPSGLSSDSTTEVWRDQSFNKLETTNRIVTQHSASMHERTTRSIDTHDNLNPSGEEIIRPTAQAYAGNVVSLPIISDIRVDVNETWSTDKYTY